MIINRQDLYYSNENCTLQGGGETLIWVVNKKKTFRHGGHQREGVIIYKTKSKVFPRVVQHVAHGKTK